MTIMIRRAVIFICIISMFLFAGCGDKNNDVTVTNDSDSYLTEEGVSTTQYTSQDIQSDSSSNSSDVGNTVSKTESRSWKDAYIEYIYELEETKKDYSIWYYPCEDFTGDGIDDIICHLAIKNNEGYYENKYEIAVAYYNGRVVTFQSEFACGFLGYDSHNKYICQGIHEDGSWSHDEDIKYYKFSNGTFELDKMDKYGYYVTEHSIVNGLSQYELISAIQKGDDHTIFT